MNVPFAVAAELFHRGKFCVLGRMKVTGIERRADIEAIRLDGQTAYITTTEGDNPPLPLTAVTIVSSGVVYPALALVGAFGGRSGELVVIGPADTQTTQRLRRLSDEYAAAERRREVEVLLDHIRPLLGPDQPRIVDVRSADGDDVEFVRADGSGIMVRLVGDPDDPYETRLEVAGVIFGR